MTDTLEEQFRSAIANLDRAYQGNTEYDLSSILTLLGTPLKGQELTGTYTGDELFTAARTFSMKISSCSIAGTLPLPVAHMLHTEHGLNIAPQQITPLSHLDLAFLSKQPDWPNFTDKLTLDSGTHSYEGYLQAVGAGIDTSKATIRVQPAHLTEIMDASPPLAIAGIVLSNSPEHTFSYEKIVEAANYGYDITGARLENGLYTYEQYASLRDQGINLKNATVLVSPEELAEVQMNRSRIGNIALCSDSNAPFTQTQIATADLHGYEVKNVYICGDLTTTPFQWLEEQAASGAILGICPETTTLSKAGRSVLAKHNVAGVEGASVVRYNLNGVFPTDHSTDLPQDLRSEQYFGAIPPNGIIRH